MSEREWQPIETAPKDGTVVLLTWMDGLTHQPAEIWPMQWGHIQRNGLFPERTGMWVSPDGSVTWNGSADDFGPTHWMPAPPPTVGGLEE
jgi:hypothetical protein